MTAYELLAFYDYPAEHWGAHPHHQPDRINLCHGPSAKQAKPELRLSGDDVGDGVQAAPERRETLKRIKGFSKLELVVNNVEFRDGVQVTDQSDRNAA